MDVLVVDDAPATLDILSAWLKEAGYVVRAALSGELALQSAFAFPPTLVILDVRMQGMDGFQVCQRLRAHVTTAEVPVIFISGLTEVADRLRGFEVGGVDFLTKPVRREEVLARVNAQMRLRVAMESLNDVNRNLEAKVVQRTADLLRERNVAQNYLDVAGVALFALDPLGKIQMMNKTGEILFGVRESSVLGMHWFDEFVHALDRDGIWQRYRELIGKGVATSTHWLLDVVRADGQVRTVSCSTKLLDATNAGTSGVLFSAEDVTEVLRVQTALRLSEEKYRARATELDNALGQLHRLTAHMHDSIERERLALATDIHDHVGASLTGARLLLDQLSRNLTNIPKQQHAMLEQARVAVSQALVSSRGVYAQLRPPMLDDLGLVHTLRWYLDDWAQKTGIQVESAIQALPQEPGEMLRMDIFRMFQELLTNVARHAGATRVKVDMQVTQDKLLLQVSDDGCGLIGKTPDGFGLQGIRGRLNRYGGVLQIENRNPRGAALTASMPSLALQQPGALEAQAVTMPGSRQSSRSGST